MDTANPQTGSELESETESSMAVADSLSDEAPAGRRTSEMLDGKILPTLLRLSAPTVALMSLQGIVSAGETAFVGRLGSSALAGASLSFPLVMLMTTLSGGAYGGGVASAVARALGRGQAAEAGEVAGTALTLSGLIGLVYMALMQLGGPVLYRAMGASGPSLEAAVAYSQILFLGTVPFWLFGAAASILRGGGNAAYPALVGAVGGLVTLAVSPILIFGAGPVPALGITGAASAIALYNVAAMVVLLRALRTGRSAAVVTLARLVPRRAHVGAILRVAIPSAVGTLLTNTTVLVLTTLVVPYGETATAGYGAGGRLEYLMIPLVFGIGSALVPLVAANDGAGQFQRVQQFTRAGACLATAACGGAGFLVALWPDLWMGLFSTDSAVLSTGRAYLARVGPAYPFLGLGLSLYFAAQGRGRTVPPLLATSARLAVVSIVGTTGTVFFHWKLESLFLLMSAGLMIYALTMVAVMRRELGLASEASSGGLLPAASTSG